MSNKNNPPPPFKHQKDAFKFISDKNVFALFMDMGTGKSKVAIMKAFDLYCRGLVDCTIIISPKAVASQWIYEQFPLHWDERPGIYYQSFLWDGKTGKRNLEIWNSFSRKKPDMIVFSINIDAFSSTKIIPFIEKLTSTRKCFVVIDESTRIKNGRRKPIRGKRAGAKRTNLLLDLFANVKYKCVMTGTPTPQGPFDLWSQFEFLQPNYFGMDYYMFTKFHGIMIRKTNLHGKDFETVISIKDYNFVKWHLSKHIKSTGYLFNAEKILYTQIAQRCNMSVEDIQYIDQMESYIGYKHLDRLSKHLSTITFYAKKEDCLDLPPVVFETLYCDMGLEQKKLYNDIKTNMLAEYAGKELTLTNKVTLTLRLQQIAGGLFPFPETEVTEGIDGEPRYKTTYKHELIENSCKIKTLMDTLEDISPEIFIIVWAVYRSEIELIVRELRKAEHTCEAYYGGSDPEVITRFKNKEFRICVISPLKGGEGLNLQHSSVQFWYSNPWKADSKDQGIARQYRLGQGLSVTVLDLIVKNSVDERIAEVLRSKMDLIEFFRTNPNEKII